MLRTQHLASLETAPLKAILDGGSGFAALLGKKIAPTYNLKGIASGVVALGFTMLHTQHLASLETAPLKAISGGEEITLEISN